MIIEKIEIALFGLYRNRTFDFKEKINIIEGDNASGKSTIAAFIRFMFYGLSSKEDEEGISERSRYTEANGGKAAGTLTLFCKYGHFKIERSLMMGQKGAPDEEICIIDLQKNAPIKGKDPAALFLSCSRDLFDHSCFLSELNERKVGSVELGQAVENLLSSADESVNAEKSAAALLLKMKEYGGEDGESGKIFEAKEELKNLTCRIEAARQLANEFSSLKSSAKENEKKAEANKKERIHYENLLAFTEATRKIERIKRASLARSKWEEAKEKLQEANDRHSCGGVLPDSGTVKDFEKLKNEGLRQKEELETAKEHLEKAKGQLARLPQTVGGKEGELLFSIQKESEKEKLSKGFFFLLSVMALLFLVFTVLFSFYKGALAWTFGVLTAADSAFLVYSYMSYAHASKKLKMLYASCGADNREDLSAAVKRQAKTEAERNTLQEKIQEEQNIIQRKTAALEEILKEAGEKARPFQKNCRSVEELQSLSEELSNIKEEMDLLKQELQDAENEFQTIRLDVSEEELKKMLQLVHTMKEAPLDGEGVRQAQMKVNFYKQTSEALEHRTVKQKEQLSQIEQKMEDVGLLVSKKNEAEQTFKNLKNQYTAYKNAYEALTQAVEEMRNRLLPGILEEASAFFKSATGEKFTMLTSKEHYKVYAVNDSGEEIPVGHLSAGLADLAYLSLRMSLTKRIFERETMPLVFDESFLRLDDLRMAATFMTLAEEPNQMFFFFCRKRESALLQKIKKSFVISL